MIYACFLCTRTTFQNWSLKRRKIPAFAGPHALWKGDPLLLLWVMTTNFPSRNDCPFPSLKPTRSYLTQNNNNKKLRSICQSGTKHKSIQIHTATFLHHVLYKNELQIFSIKVIKSVQSRQPLFVLEDVSVLFHITSFCSKLWLLGHRGSTITELLFKGLRLEEWRSTMFADWQEATGLFYFN